MRTVDSTQRIEKARALMRGISRAVYAEIPAGRGVADDDGDVPAQRNYFCIADVDGAPRCVATLTAVGMKVLCLIPHAGSGLCSRCEYLDADRDGQAGVDALLRSLFTGSASIVPIALPDEPLCRDPAPELCPDCRHRPRSDSERPMERPS